MNTAMKPVIRFGRSADAEALTRVAHEAYAQYVDVIGRQPAPMTADYSAHLRDDQCLVAELKGDDAPVVAGFVIVTEQSDGYWIETVAVRPQYSGQGLGRDLVCAAEQWVGSLANSVQLYTNAKMTRNLTWYPKLGYREVGRRHERGFDRVFFHKQLG